MSFGQKPWILLILISNCLPMCLNWLYPHAHYLKSQKFVPNNLYNKSSCKVQAEITRTTRASYLAKSHGTCLHMCLDLCGTHLSLTLYVKTFAEENIYIAASYRGAKECSKKKKTKCNTHYKQVHFQGCRSAARAILPWYQMGRDPSDTLPWS